jgi:hypothetical protein
MIDKLNGKCTREEFLYFERVIFHKVLKGNVFIKTPFDFLGELLAHLEDSGENVAVL